MVSASKHCSLVHDAYLLARKKRHGAWRTAAFDRHLVRHCKCLARQMDQLGLPHHPSIKHISDLPNCRCKIIQVKHCRGTASKHSIFSCLTFCCLGPAIWLQLSFQNQSCSLPPFSTQAQKTPSRAQAMRSEAYDFCLSSSTRQHPPSHL